MTPAAYVTGSFWEFEMNFVLSPAIQEIQLYNKLLTYTQECIAISLAIHEIRLYNKLLPYMQECVRLIPSHQRDTFV